MDLLRSVAAEVAPCLTALFNAVVRQKQMPRDMAIGHILVGDRAVENLTDLLCCMLHIGRRTLLLFYTVGTLTLEVFYSCIPRGLV